ncbi:MAG TPA: hypothetical protein VNW54_06260 [Granulicella sp.]|jgi:hypothetical protein|nr:hypothetical protein [Granulicella sp.]
MPSRTTFLNRLIGLYCILVVAAMLLHRQSTLSAVTAILHDPSMTFLTGVIASVAGLAMVLLHNVWSGGARTVLVTLVGWILLGKGLLLLLLPPEAEAAFFLNTLRYQQLFYLYMTICLALGAFLAYGGFSSKRPA